MSDTTLAAQADPGTLAPVLFEQRDGIARITLNRPKRLNSLNPATTSALLAALQRAGADPQVHVVLLTGSGRGFCAGADLSEWDPRQRPDLGDIVSQHYNPLIEALQALPVPVVAAVNGPAAGAGANLALACDIVVAARSAHFLQAFTKIGLLPDAGGTWWLPRLLGPARALGLALLAEPLPAEQAAQWGLIWRCVEDADLATVAEALATRLAQLPAGALRSTREAIRGADRRSLTEQLALEARMQRELGFSPDFAEGVAAFMHKRAPRFAGAPDVGR